ncbi:MAG: hypothetical protein AWU55_2337 [Halomonadaceae bacterium T82-2]|nr:MAG: hypothetical protein AWU55_2337 [Halomonadaceae bacterium T82-2]
MQLDTLPADMRIISKPSLCRSWDMTRSGLDKLSKNDPTFPRPIKFGQTRQAGCYFVVAEVEAWLEAKMAERGAA